MIARTSSLSTLPSLMVATRLMKKPIIVSLLLFVTGCVSNAPLGSHPDRCELSKAMENHQLSASDLARMSREANRLYTYPDGTRPQQALSDEKICTLVTAGTIKIFDPANVETKQPEPHNNTLAEPLDSDLFYIRITRFVDDTVVELKEILRSRAFQSARGIVIDLRGNLGGSLYSVNKAAQLLGPGNVLIGETRGGMPDKYYTDKKDSLIGLDKPLAIVVNARTASGAELFAAFLKNHQHGTLIGETTAGVGLVRTVARINANAIMLIPVNYLFDSNGKPIEGNGVEPDIAMSESGCREFYGHNLCKAVVRQALASQ